VQPAFTTRPAWRYGFLLLILLLLAWSIWILPENLACHKSPPYSGIIIPLMLLFNHLSANFVQSPEKKKIANIMALSFVILGGAYICFWRF
jgi:hypothetical protein